MELPSCSVLSYYFAITVFIFVFHFHHLYIVLMIFNFKIFFLKFVFNVTQNGFYYQDVQIVSYQSKSLSIVMTMIIYMYQLCINVVYVVMHTFVCTGNGTDELENIVVTGVVDGKCGRGRCTETTKSCYD